MEQKSNIRVLVLGAGMVGGAIVRDLAADARFCVGAADRADAALAGLPAAERHAVDLADGRAVSQLAARYDLVVGALPSALGWQALCAVIDAGRDYCDVSFMGEDPLQADEHARARGVTAIVDCGVAPGLTHMLAGAATAQLARCRRIAMYVGGLPARPEWPFEYKAGFSPRDVLEEYTRPVRMVEDGRIVRKEALSELETLEFSGVGTLEAFNTDGLRSLLTTVQADAMSEKTLRYPGHAELMRVLRHLGLFRDDAVPVGGDGTARVRPIDLTEALLFPLWQFAPGEADLTVMRVVVEGDGEGGAERFCWEMIDRYDEQSRMRSMSRVTGFTCTAALRLLAEGRFRRPGVHPPERLGEQPELLERVLGDLRQRGIFVQGGRDGALG